jgi:hypothetical protein
MKSIFIKNAVLNTYIKQQSYSFEKRFLCNIKLCGLRGYQYVKVNILIKIIIFLTIRTSFRDTRDNILLFNQEGMISLETEWEYMRTYYFTTIHKCSVLVPCVV